MSNDKPEGAGVDVRKRMADHVHDMIRHDLESGPCDSKFRAWARDIYSGWNGWHHQWHWRESGLPLMRRLHTQALDACVEMTAKADDLRARAEACGTLARTLERAIDAEEAYQAEQGKAE